MSSNPRATYELAGVAFVIVAAVASMALAAVLSPLFPWLDAPWVFVVVTAGVIGWGALFGRLSPGAILEGATGDGSDDGGDGDGPEDVGVLDVALVDWANALVGTRCLRCEDEITYVPLGVTDGRSKHRIECGCTIIESVAKD